MDMEFEEFIKMVESWPKPEETKMTLEGEIEIRLTNYKTLLREAVNLEDRMMSTFESDSGREDEPIYPIQYAEYRKELSEVSKGLIGHREDLDEFAKVNSIKLANDYASDLSKEYKKEFKVCKREKDGLQYLVITNNSEDGEEIIIDVGKTIDENTIRNLFEGSRVIDGVSYEIHSFLPEKFERLFTISFNPREHIID